METKNRQVRFARWLKENVDLPGGIEDFHVHLSGCTASCAQPQIADVSLRGMKTRKNGEAVEALDIGLGEEPRFADWMAVRVPADEVPGAIANLLAAFADRREDGETFRAFVERTDEETLGESVEPEETSYEVRSCTTRRRRGIRTRTTTRTPAPHRPTATAIRWRRTDGRRILKANAFTTLDLADGAVRTHDRTESAPAVVDVTAPRKAPDHLESSIEVDDVTIDVPAHADTVELSPDQARAVAADLEKYAARVENDE